MDKEKDHRHGAAKNNKANISHGTSQLSADEKNKTATVDGKHNEHKAESTASVAELAKLAHSIEEQKTELKKAKARKRRRTIIIVIIVAIVVVGLVIALITTRTPKNTKNSGSGSTVSKSQTDILVDKETSDEKKEKEKKTEAEKNRKTINDNLKKAKTDSEKIQNYMQLAYSYSETGDQDEMNETIEKMLKEFPNNDEAYAMAGSFYSTSYGNYQSNKALDCYQRALEIVQSKEQTAENQNLAKQYQTQIDMLKKRK